NWVMMSRSGPTTNTAMGVNAANGLNNPSPANTNYVIGRFAYAIYDEGSLLDITVAGHPSALTNSAQVAQLAQIKGTLAGADVSVLGIDPDALIAWRNSASQSAYPSYVNYVTNFAATNGFQQVFSTNGTSDNTFLSRQDLISAAQNGIAGLTTSALTNLATFTREANVPSTGPSYNATDLGGTNGTGSMFAYKNNALTAGSTNRFIPSVRVTSANAGYQGYHDDGTLYVTPDAIKPGDSVVRRRFSLARLNWLGPNGPNAAGFNPSVTTAQQKAAIQACFGLVWAKSLDSNLSASGASLWQYVGPTGSAEQSAIETLDQVAAETPTREPNFFELLQAGILSGSLAVGGTPNATSPIPNSHLKYTMLQLLRIGASIVDQYDADSSPTLIEYNQNVVSKPWIAAGTESLPYMNTYETVAGLSPDNPSALAVYLLCGLWNPARQPFTAPTVSPPPIRIHLQGNFSIHTQYADTNSAPVILNPDGSGVPGYIETIPNTTVLPLSTTSPNGAYGFLDPTLPVSADTASAPPLSGAINAAYANNKTGTWVVTPPLGVNSKNYVGYRMPDLPLDTNATHTHTTSSPGVTATYSFFTGAAGANSTFGAFLEYQQNPPSGPWVPYSYATGINDISNTWLQSGAQQSAAKFAEQPAGGPYTIKTIPSLAGTISTLGPSLGLTPLYMTSDPRSLRFGEWQFDRFDTGTASSYATTAGEDARLWRATMPVLSGSSNPNNSWQASGYGGGLTGQTPASPPPVEVQATSPIFGNFYYPAQLARNNAPNVAPISSYTDRDGILRIGDSGLYPSSQDYSAGNPFAGNLVRPQDRPVVLNRPFQSVAELGYVLRDDPWRSLDFFSANSADSELLDLFCVNETTSSTGTVAGKINLNSQNTLALQAVLNSTITDALPATPATLTKPSAIAQDLANFTLTTPFANKADLVNKFMGSTTALPSSAFNTTGDEQNIKAQREAIVRALADVGQTRTWNLMIDIVAQAGRYPPTANTLDQFVVEGERRYWLHIAIDRFTGKIVDQKLEPVAE
ncbi:MAG TPA: hypothetical protein VGC39_09500, partial [Candidatus Methylacidiphilales bacterium]